MSYRNMREIQAERALKNGTASHASAPQLRFFDLELSVRPRVQQWALAGVIKMIAPIKEAFLQLDFEGTIFCRRPLVLDRLYMIMTCRKSVAEGLGTDPETGEVYENCDEWKRVLVLVDPADFLAPTLRHLSVLLGTDLATNFPLLDLLSGADKGVWAEYIKEGYSRTGIPENIARRDDLDDDQWEAVRGLEEEHAEVPLSEQGRRKKYGMTYDSLIDASMNVFAAGIKEKRDKQHLSDLIAALAAFPLHASDYAAATIAAPVCSKAAPPDGVAEGPAEFLRRYGRQAQASDSDSDSDSDDEEDEDSNDEEDEEPVEDEDADIEEEEEDDAAANVADQQGQESGFEDVDVTGGDGPSGLQQHVLDHQNLATGAAGATTSGAVYGPHSSSYAAQDWQTMYGATQVRFDSSVPGMHLQSQVWASPGATSAGQMWPPPGQHFALSGSSSSPTPLLGPFRNQMPYHSTNNMINSSVQGYVPNLAQPYVPSLAQPYVPNQAMQPLANPNLPYPRAPTGMSNNSPMMLRLPLQPVNVTPNNPNMPFPRMQSRGTTFSDAPMLSLPVQPTGIVVGNAGSLPVPTDQMGQSAVATISDPSTGAQVSSTAAAAASPLFGPYGQQQVLAASGGTMNGQGQAYGRRRGGRRSQRKAGLAVGSSSTRDASTGPSARGPRPTRPATY